MKVTSAISNEGYLDVNSEQDWGVNLVGGGSSNVDNGFAGG